MFVLAAILGLGMAPIQAPGDSSDVERVFEVAVKSVLQFTIERVKVGQASAPVYLSLPSFTKAAEDAKLTAGAMSSLPTKVSPAGAAREWSEITERVGKNTLIANGGLWVSMDSLKVAGDTYVAFVTVRYPDVRGSWGFITYSVPVYNRGGGFIAGPIKVGDRT